MRKRYTNLENSKVSMFLFVLCWAVYFGMYFSREGYAAALAGIIESGDMLKDQASVIGTVYFFSYGIGQLCSGFLADRISPFKMIGTGVLVSSAANFIMSSIGTNLPVMMITWGINGLAQSMLWTPILFIMSNLLVSGKCERAVLDIAATIPLGTLGAYLCSTVVLKYAKWDKVFLTSSLVLAVIFVGWVFMSLYVKRFIKYRDDIPMQNEENKNDSAKSGKLFPLLATSGVLLALIPITINGMLREGVNTWVPTMISEMFEVDASFSTMLSIFLPIVNLSGAYAALFVYKKFFRNEVKSGIVFFIISILPMFGLIFLNGSSVVLGLVLLSLITSSMIAINQLFVAMMPVHFAKHGKVATVSGMMNFIAYMGCAIANYGIGTLAQKYNWNVTIAVWIGFGVLAIVLCFFIYKKWEEFTKGNRI